MPRIGLTLLLLLGLACRSRPSAAPGQVAERFYAATSADQISGAPTPEQLARLTPLLSDSLRALLAAARLRHDQEAERSPGEKPPFAEGDLFSSLFEGPSSFSIVTDSARDRGHAVTVAMTHRDSAGAVVSWADTVLLTPVGGSWVVDDIAYGGSWDFASRGTLRAQLLAGLGAP